MKRLALALLFSLLTTLAHAQCNGVFANNTACGNISGAPGLPGQVPISSFPTNGPGGAINNIQYNAGGGTFGGFGPVTGDMSLSVPGGVATLATVNANVGTFGSGNCVTFTANAKGLITAASTVACSAVSIPATLITYTASWANAVQYTQQAVNNNEVRMTDFMGTTTCDGVIFVGTQTGTVVTVTATGTGSLAVGMKLAPGAGGITTTITSLGTGTGGLGTYNVSTSQSVASTTWKGGTDQTTNMQRFLTAVATSGSTGSNGVNGSVTGRFAPGNCFVTASPTITTNSNYVPVNYRYIGYGTSIMPDPTQAISGLDVVRGTFLTRGDEQRTITIEGLSINGYENASLRWGIQVIDTRVMLIRVNCLSGDDAGVHSYVNFACYRYTQSDPNDPNSGAFYGKIFQSTCKGHGTGTGGVPLCVRVDGSGGNALVIAENAFAQGNYAIRLFNPCASDTDNCAYMPNNTIIRDNNIEAFAVGVNYQTSVPGRSRLVGGIVEGNTFELISSCSVDIATIAVQSSADQAAAIGPNTGISGGTALCNTNAIQVIRPAAKS